MHSSPAVTSMNKETNLTLLESSLYSQLLGGGVSRKGKECDPDAKYRTLDGRCNNLVSPEWGATATPLPRLMDNAYSDGKFLTQHLLCHVTFLEGVSMPRGGRDPSVLPSARSVSVAVHHVLENRPRPSVSHMVMQFGQFLDHDITLTSQPGDIRSLKTCILTLNDHNLFRG